MDIVYTKSAEVFANKLGAALQLPVFQDGVRAFSCGELCVSLPKSFNDVVVISSTVTNDDWIELFLLLDALRDASSLTLCLTYVGYSRQDKDVPFMSRGTCLFSSILKKHKISHCIFVDIHNKNCLDSSVIHISAADLFALDISKKFNLAEVVVVSPDIGGATRAKHVAEFFGADCIVGHKRREPSGELIDVSFNSNVKNKVCVLVDDIIDSGATLHYASKMLLDAGCSDVVVYATHRVLSGSAVNLLANSDISEINLTDSIQVKQELPTKFKEISIVPLIAETIKCII